MNVANFVRPVSPANLSRAQRRFATLRTAPDRRNATAFSGTWTGSRPNRQIGRSLAAASFIRRFSPPFFLPQYGGALHRLSSQIASRGTPSPIASFAATQSSEVARRILGQPDKWDFCLTGATAGRRGSCSATSPSPGSNSSCGDGRMLNFTGRLGRTPR